MRIESLFPALALLVGCASGAPTPQGPQERIGDPVSASAMVDRVRQGRVTHIRPDVVRVANDIQGTPEEVWGALNQVYEGLEIEVVGRNPENLSLSNPDFRVFRRLGGNRLSTYIDCGSGMTGHFADRYRVRMNILSQVKPGPDGTSVLETTIEATGRNPDGTGGGNVACGSTHRLEARIAGEVAELVRQ